MALPASIRWPGGVMEKTLPGAGQIPDRYQTGVKPAE
jgi:hypothetical protein